MSHPGQLAMLDQARAMFGAEVEKYVKLYDMLRAKVGSEQASADLTALFRNSDRFDEVIVCALLASAVQTIAESRTNHPEGRS